MDIAISRQPGDSFIAGMNGPDISGEPDLSTLFNDRDAPGAPAYDGDVSGT